jgi:hypothetical protein
LNKTSAAGQSYSSAERDSALAKLMHFAARDEFKEAHRSALQLFWGDWLLNENEDLERVKNSEQTNLAYHSWFVFDFDLGGGRIALDFFLEREASRLISGEHRYLEGMRDSHLRLYEVLEVKADEGFELRDLWDDRRLWVRERLGTRQIVQWDLIIGRIGAAGDGGTVFEVLPYVFPAAHKDDLVSGLRKSHRVFTRERPGASLIDFFRSMASVFQKLWLERVALRPLPQLMTPEGDPLIFAKAIFDVRDRERVIKTLASSRDLVAHEDGTYGWLEEKGTFQRSLGALVLENDRLVLETTSLRRAERAKEFLQGLLGDAVRFRVATYEDVGQALKRMPDPAGKKEPDIPPEVQAEIVGQFYEKHYREWMDKPVPALGNRTPRHAATLKTVRPKLIALLKDMESRSERERRAGKTAYDFGWMWKELGVTRE